MRINIFIFLYFIFVISIQSNANILEQSNDSILKNSIGINTSFINTPQISYYLSSPVSKNNVNTISPKIDIVYNRFLRKNFFIGINLSYLDLTFEGNDYHPMLPSNSLKSKLNYKIVLGYISLIKEFKITEKFIIGPSIEAGIGKNINGFLQEDIVNNNNVISSKRLFFNQKNLIVSTALQTNFVYRINKNNRVFIGIGANAFSINYYDYLPIKNMFYNLNVGYKYAF
ncbi:MAG: hypothetical protein ACK4ON_02665 [Bacteroidia bacterium]